MTPTSHATWTSKGLLAVFRDALPAHDLTSTTRADGPTAASFAPLLDDVVARQARIDRIGQRLKHLVHVADAPADAAMTA